MAKKQTRRSISVSRTTYEKLKAFCEANNISMSQFVETRVGDFLGEAPAPAPAPSAMLGGTLPRPSREPSRPLAAAPMAPRPSQPMTASPVSSPVAAAPRPPQQVPMTSAAARYAVEPPPPIIKPKSDHDAAAPAPVVKTADQIFTF
jgi:hypothetical protein